MLPSLGEQDVQLSTIAGLRPSVRVRSTAPDGTGALKGDVWMANVIERAVGDRERAPRHDFTVLLDGLQLRVRRRETVRLVEGVQRRRGTHNEQRPQLAQRFIDLLVARYKSAAIRSYSAAPTAGRRPTSRACSTATARSTRAWPAPSCAARLARGLGARVARRASAAAPK